MSKPQILMKIRRFATQFQYFMIAFVLMSICPLLATAQDVHSHTVPQQDQEGIAEQAERASKNCQGIDGALPGCKRGGKRRISP